MATPAELAGWNPEDGEPPPENDHGEPVEPLAKSDNVEDLIQ